MQNTAWKKRIAILAALTLLTVTGCNSEDSSAESAVEGLTVSENGTVTADISEAVSASDIELSSWDTDTEWDDSAVTVTFDGSTISASSEEGLTISGSVLTVTSGGTYVLSGKLDDGRIVINLTDHSEKVHLIMNGVSVSCSTTSPLTVVQADKTVITLADGTENALSDASEYTVFDEEAETEEDSAFPNACLASKDDLTVNGTGALTVTANYYNGIQTKDDLKLIGGAVTVVSANHGVRGNDSVLIYDGTLDITSGGDGVKSTTADTAGKGYVVMAGGAVTIRSEQDGIDAAATLSISGGTLDMTAGGGTSNAAAHTDNMMGGRGGWNRSDTAASDTDDSTSVSMKGIKAAGTLEITGGTITANAADDTIHSDSDVVISGSAVLELAAGDDGIHGDNSVTISDSAQVTVTESYEGIESYIITISGGETRITASDDGVNASDGGNSESAGGGFAGMGATDGYLYLNGGYLFVNAGGDGLDSNGDIVMTGGTVVVAGPTNDGNGPLDSGDNQNTITVTGGTLLAVGSTGMMEVPEENYISTASLGAAAGTLIVVTDADGKVLGALQTPKQAQGLVFSADGMSDGYYVYTGGTYDGDFNSDGFAVGGSYTAGELVVSGSGGSGGTMGGGFGGGMQGGGRTGRGGNMGQPGEMSMPDDFDPSEFDGGFPGAGQMPDGGFEGGNPPAMPDGGDFENMTPPGGFSGQ